MEGPLVTAEVWDIAVDMDAAMAGGIILAEDSGAVLDRDIMDMFRFMARDPSMN